jgi:flagellar hook-basal body complex protein FliE
MSGLLLDAQKAEISLNLALQIRNKVIDAYNDIIKMQV